MEVKQIYDLVNDSVANILGTEAELLKEDMSNLVDIGNTIFDTNNVDNYCYQLIDRIGKTKFWDRLYRGDAPDIMVDKWTYGSVVQRIAVKKHFEATENESWKLENGKSYDDNVFYAPEMTVKYYNKMATYEIHCSFTRRQLKESFKDETALTSFFNMIENEISNSLTMMEEKLIKGSINNMIGETFYDYNSSGDYTGEGNTRCINLLRKYNDQFELTGTDDELTADECLTDAEFCRYASYEMSLWLKRIQGMSTVFNLDGAERFTPVNKLKVVLHNDFKRGANAYLESDTFNADFVKLPDSHTVAYWQGTGDDFDFAETSKIKVTTASGHDVTASGILGVAFDNEAVVMSQLDKRVTSKFVNSGEFYNNFYKVDIGFYNSLDNNFIVFYVA